MCLLHDVLCWSTGLLAPIESLAGTRVGSFGSERVEEESSYAFVVQADIFCVVSMIQSIRSNIERQTLFIQIYSLLIRPFYLVYGP